MMLNIALLPDLLREVPAFPEGFFDMIREPIRQGCGIDIGAPPSAGLPGGMGAGFDIDRFRQLALADAGVWSSRYHQIPALARDYLLQHLRHCDFLFAFEMPPWLAALCTEQRLPFLDIRVSPLRFGRDLYIALRCSEPALVARIAAQAVPGEELRMEAALLAANVRMHQRRMEDERGYAFTDLAGALVFVGQAPYDASLLAADGRSLRCGDFAERLRQLCASRRLLYKPHPFAGTFAQEERAALAQITGQVATLCPQNAYQILSTRDDVELVGISSGLLQEAAWFDKAAHTLFQPFVALADVAPHDPQAYHQIHFKTFLAPGFWHRVLTPERGPPRLAELPALAHHHARETLDQWWDYSKVLTWERSLPYEAFIRNGGARLRERVDALEHAAPASSPLAAAMRAAAPDAGEWQRCLDAIQHRIAQQPLQFGRGQLYQGHESWNVPGQRPTLRRLAEYRVDSWLPSHAKVLDIGCNIGMFGLTLAPAIDSYHGIDHTAALIDIAQALAAARRIDNCTFECNDFAAFVAGARQRYDVILSFAVHVWIGMPLDDYAAILHRLLAPGGRLVLESNNLASNDKDFFANIQYFVNAGFRVHSRGLLKDDGIIERAFYVFERCAEPVRP